VSTKFTPAKLSNPRARKRPHKANGWEGPAVIERIECITIAKMETPALLHAFALERIFAKNLVETFIGRNTTA